MSGFLAKLRVVTLGSVHDLLDRAIDLNSPSVIRQYTRDLERPKAADLVRMRAKFAGADENIEHAKKASVDIDVAVSNLEGKHAAMVDRVRQLEQLDRDTKAKNSAASALAAAGRLIQGGADISVDDVQQRMARNNDVAQE